MRPEVRKKLEDIRAPYLSRSYHEIKRLGWINLDRITLNNRKYEPSIWSELMPDDKVLLVVQLTHWIFLRIFGATDCIGFIKDKDNKVILVDEKYLMEEIGHP